MQQVLPLSKRPIDILSEEIYGPHASPRLGMVLLANAPWLLVPIVVIARMAPDRHPFEEQRP